MQVVLPSEKDVLDCQPNIDELLKSPINGGVIITGVPPAESEFDFYSRFFCPKFGIDEVLKESFLNVLMIENRDRLCMNCEGNTS